MNMQANGFYFLYWLAYLDHKSKIVMLLQKSLSPLL